jgi:hypothetical protein
MKYFALSSFRVFVIKKSHTIKSIKIIITELNFCCDE